MPARAIATCKSTAEPTPVSPPVKVTRRLGLGVLASGLGFVAGERTGLAAEAAETKQGLASCELRERPWCLSSYDDRPPHFFYPYTRDDDTRTRDDIRKAAAAELRKLDFAIKDEVPGVLLATNESITVEFEFLTDDDVVTVRVTPTNANNASVFNTSAAASRKVKSVLVASGCVPVPILRNRKSALGVFETPFDTFGPTPPPFGDAIAELS